MVKRMGRRSFQKYSLTTSIVVWAGEEVPKLLGINSGALKELFFIDAALASDSVFAQSVASGDPQPNGITLSTGELCSAASSGS